MARLRPKAPPHKATCACCMSRLSCEKQRRKGSPEMVDEFKYSEDHRGWLCRTCWAKWQHALERGVVV